MKTQHPHADLETFENLESEVRSYVRSFPTVFERAKGHELFDEDGRSYIDFFAGAGALNYGHNNPCMQDRLVEYLQGDNITHALDMATAAKRRFIERFQEVVLEPRGLDYRFLFPGPTGTNAIEAALKLARKATGRKKVYAFEGGFHGMTLGSLAITSNRMKRKGAGVPLPHAKLLPFEGQVRDGKTSLEFLEAELDQDAAQDALPAAIAVETVQCEGGVVVASTAWLRSLAETCKRHGVLLIVDDIQAGCGRTGSFFSFDEAGIRPDIVCLSKSLSGMGLPMALVLVSPELDVFQPGEHNGTFRGFNPAFVTAEAALGFWADDKLAKAVRHKSRLVRERLEKLRTENPGAVSDVRGRGLVQGLELSVEGLAGEISKQCFERGLVIETAGHQDEVLKLLPSLTIDEDALVRGLDVVEESFAAALTECTADSRAE